MKATKEDIMELLSDCSIQDGETYEQRTIPDYKFDNLAESLIENIGNEKHPIIKAFVKWQQENPDEDEQYNEIHGFFSDFNRGEMLDFMTQLI